MPDRLNIFNFNILQGEALHRQITRHIRLLIYAGKLTTGSKLPRMHDLARHWCTNYFTVHTAFTRLVEEGLLERKPRVGTIVRQQNAELRSVGIYYGDEILTKPDRAFYRAVHSQLLALLQKEGIANRVFIDCRPPLQQREPLRELSDAIQSKSIQGLIVPLSGANVADWVESFPLPTSIFSARRTECSRIFVDNSQLIRMAFQAVQKAGCTTVGLIHPVPPSAAGGGRVESDTLLNAFHSLLTTFGLKTNPSWVRVPEIDRPAQEMFGYEEFHKIWSLSKRPESLIVFPENVARGVVLAAMECRANVPSDLRLVLHKNQNVDFLCPLPVDWIVTREKDVAKALIQQIKDRSSGLAPKEYEIRQTFVPATGGRDAGAGRSPLHNPQK